MQSFLREHSLSLAIGTLLVFLLLVGYLLPSSMEEHAQNFFGMGHDTFGALIIVVFTKYLRERGSAESKGE